MQPRFRTLLHVQLHLAQFNVGTLRAPIDHPDTAAFTNALPEVNALAESSPGYVWRLQTDAGDATSISAYENPLTIVNLTVWESLETLRDFVTRGMHRDFLRRRGDWFEPGSGLVHWWIPAGTTPTVEQAKRRLAFLERFGPTAHAFGPRSTFPTSVVVRRSLDHPDVPAMLQALDHELLSTEPEGGICHITLDPEHVADDNGAFFVAYHDGRPRACGAYRRISDDAAEVKRMWADPECRGAKLGAAVLDTIEGAARADGYQELRLETGEHLTAAVGLYTAFGFTPCEPWGDYLDSPLSHCMAKRLT